MFFSFKVEDRLGSSMLKGLWKSPFVSVVTNKVCQGCEGKIHAQTVYIVCVCVAMFMLCYVSVDISCDVMSCHVMSSYVMLCYVVVLYHVI